MWLSLFCLALFAAVAYFQVIHGLFSALIMFVICALSLAIAFNFYEYIAMNWLLSLQPDLAMPIAFLLSFAGPLIALRLLFDAVIKRMVLVPIIVDKAGAAIFGILSGLICVGALALALQMLPMDGGLLGYARVERFVDPHVNEEMELSAIQTLYNAENDKVGKYDDRKYEEGLWLTPDRFAVGMAGLLSEGSLSGERSLALTHPDLVQTLGWMQATEFDTRHLVPPNAVRVEGTLTPVEEVFDRIDPRQADAEPKYTEVKPKRDKFYALKIELLDPAKDRDGIKRFQLRQIVLMGRDKNRPGELTQYHPIGLAVKDNKGRREFVRILGHSTSFGDLKNPAADVVFQPGQPTVQGQPSGGETENPDMVELLFDLPETPEKFIPGLLMYKFGTRVAVRLPGRETEAGPAQPVTTVQPVRPPPPSDAVATSGGGPGVDAGAAGGNRYKPGGRVGGARVIVQGTHYGDDLPMNMTAYQGLDDETGPAATLVQGHLVANVADQGEKSEGTTVSRFKVPDEKRLLHLNVQNLRARSGLGKALSQAVKVLENFRVIDDRGKAYSPVGKYAVADVDGAQVVEIEYFPGYAESGARAHKPFQKIKDRHLQGNDYELVYLYLVDPGAKLVQFKTGSESSPAEDLTGAVPDAPP